MTNEGENQFEALVYSNNRETILRCCRAFTDIPLNWMTLDSADLASSYLTRERFDFVLLDLDSPEGPSILRRMGAKKSPHGAVLAISGGEIDSRVLELCYKSQFFYPVRPDEIESHLERAVQLVEGSSVATESRVQVPPSINAKQRELLSDSHFDHGHEAPKSKRAAILPQMMEMGGKLVGSLGDLFRNQHSLSVVAQERAASAMAALGAIWFVNIVTTNFTEVAKMGPPPSGPLELIGLSVLLWLCAKHRRVAVRHEEAIQVS